MLEEKNTPLQTLKRLPFYLHYLEELEASGIEYISTPKIAMDLGFNEMSVKKDFACVTTEKGKPKVGHKVINLLNDLKTFLGCNLKKSACLVGVGNLGRALMGFKGFKRYGLEITMAFDINPEVVGKTIQGIKVYNYEELGTLCRLLEIPIGIITVGGDDAQKVCDTLVKAGVSAIWNFAPVHLKVPSYVVLQNENMASSLAVLLALTK